MRTALLLGGAGYIGVILCRELLEKGYRVLCVDRCFFGEEPIASLRDHERFKLVKDDIRSCESSVFDGVDVVMDMAGISNDPSCDLDPRLTDEINYEGAVRAARCAKQAGVERYLYSSSCSIYGAGQSDNMTEEAEPSPVSLYAKVKFRTEQALSELASDDFCVAHLRNATAFGLAPRMRFDLMVNLMTAHAVTQRKIFVFGGGKQWRPIVHVRDIARAFLSVDQAPSDQINREVFNVGSDRQNYRVIHVANMVASLIPNIEVEVLPADPDKRTYHVGFDKIKNVLGFDTEHPVEEGIREVQQAVEAGTCDLDDLRTSTVRYYEYLIEANRVLDQVKLGGRLF